VHFIENPFEWIDGNLYERFVHQLPSSVSTESFDLRGEVKTVIAVGSLIEKET
jgi:hypothetical protein